MKIGYARTSTLDQEAGLQDQIERLKSAGCEKVFTEKVSSVDTRPKLEMAIEFVRDGDAVVITKLDRFARSVLNLWELIQQVEKKGAGLIILDFGGNTIDTRTAAGRAMLNMFGTMAQFEREVMLERQRVGIARAKAEGKYKGSPRRAIRPPRCASWSRRASPRSRSRGGLVCIERACIAFSAIRRRLIN